VVVWDAPVASAIRASHQVWAICAGQLPGFSRFGGWHLYPYLNARILPLISAQKLQACRKGTDKRDYPTTDTD
jgi:hypothetical protein